MLFEILQRGFVTIVAPWTQAGDGDYCVGLTTLSLFATYLIWRLWTFTIFPACFPQEPKEVPYSIPSR